MNRVKLSLGVSQSEALRYAIAAWFNQLEGEDLTGEDNRRARQLERIQDEIIRQEREIRDGKGEAG